MFTLFSTIVAFLTGYLTGKFNDDNLEEILQKLNQKAKDLDIDFKRIMIDAFDSLEKTDSDEIKANVIRAIDKIKEKTAEIANEDDLEGSIEKIKENVQEVKDTFNNISYNDSEDVNDVVKDNDKKDVKKEKDTFEDKKDKKDILKKKGKENE